MGRNVHLLPALPPPLLGPNQSHSMQTEAAGWDKKPAIVDAYSGDMPPSRRGVALELHGNNQPPLRELH